MRINVLLTTLSILFSLSFYDHLFGQATNKIDTVGNIGIGTTSPAFKLDVTGDVRVGNSLYFGSIGNPTRNQLSKGFYRLTAPNDLNTLDVTVSNSQIDFASNFYGGGFSIPILINTYPNTNQLFLGTNGNVGIGTINPEQRLDVYGGDNGLTSAMIVRASRSGWGNVRGQFKVYSSGSYTTDRMEIGVGNSLSALTVLDCGNVGIGTINPEQRLDVYGGDNGLTSAMIVRASRSGWGNVRGQFKVYSSGSYTTDRMEIGVGNSLSALTVLDCGNVGIGIVSPSEKLSVNGNISSKKSIVTQTGWSDYVFNDDYKLRPLREVSKYIKDNKHLPEVPSAKEVEEKGLDLGANQAVLLKKIEELTLYLLEQEKRNKEQDQRIAELTQALQAIEKTKQKAIK